MNSEKYYVDRLLRGVWNQAQREAKRRSAPDFSLDIDFLFSELERQGWSKTMTATIRSTEIVDPAEAAWWWMLSDPEKFAAYRAAVKERSQLHEELSALTAARGTG